ncbi:Scr1 family TA system antitoxin-like transcriptional regulator, partial [Actinomadura chokoriensis]|uniref:Scr1 family TA system antitoxin-like transcriptional regulator n=1 Tax=Actinomadura chokoriensis TaxID=454156 RepID=UPI0031FA1652
MLDLYGGEEAVKLALMQLARDIRKRGWWSAFNDVLTGSFAELEDDAANIRSWQVQCVPGLLQTSDYALALIRIGSPEDPEDVLLRRLQARMARRAILERQNGPSYTVVLDEAALSACLRRISLLVCEGAWALADGGPAAAGQAAGHEADGGPADH